MAANWFRGWSKKSQQASDSKAARRRELRLETLEDRTVPAVLDPLNTTGSVPPIEETISETPTESTTEGNVGAVTTTAAESENGVTPTTPQTVVTPIPGTGKPVFTPGTSPDPTSPTTPLTRDERIMTYLRSLLTQEKGPPVNPFDTLIETTTGRPVTRMPQEEIERRRLQNYNMSKWGQDPRMLTIVSEQEPNDTPDEANPVPLGSGGGQDVDVQINGTIGANDDVDFFAIDLQAGDIIGGTVVSLGALDPTVAFFDPNGFALMANDDDAISIAKAPESPLPTSAVATDPYFSVVVGETGRYTLAIASSGQASNGAYTANLAVRRPVMESAPIGEVQRLFLDFDGGVIPAGTVQNPADATISPLSAFLANWGLTAADEDAVIDAIVAQVQRAYDAVRIGGAVPGTNPNYDIEILNSRDDPDTFGTDPFVSRVFIGGTVAELGVSTIGIAEFVEVGNFSLDDTAITLLDTLSAPAGSGFSANDIQLAGGLTIIDAIGAVVGNITSHEAGHFFGLMHTDNANAVDNIIDSGGNFNGIVGTGPDGILGTADDTPLFHVVDAFDPGQGNAGNEDSTNHIAWGLTSQAQVSDAEVLAVFDVSLSMAAISGIDVNGDGVVDENDDLNGSDGQGSLLDFALFTASEPQPTIAGAMIFAREARTLDMDPNGSDFILTAQDVDNNGVSDFQDTIRSIKIGEGGYFTRAIVNPNPTLYDSVLRNILLTASPDTLVTIYTDGSGRLSDNSVALQQLVSAGIRVNVVIIGPYQTVAPTDDAELIAQATGGVVRSFPSLTGRAIDGGFPTTVNPGGNPGAPYLIGNGRQYAGIPDLRPLHGGGTSGGDGATGGSGAGSGSGSGTGSGGTGSDGPGSSGELPLGVLPGDKVVVDPLDTLKDGTTDNTGGSAGLGDTMLAGGEGSVDDGDPNGGLIGGDAAV